jgi:peptidoglycan/xylan/chitin deacetylase (PgdA/CDA1 family)
VLAKIARGNPKKKLIALTFDDGPHPDFTPQLLDILEREKVRATFFVIGKMVERYPDLVRQIRDHGHVIANHSFSHVTLSKIPGADVPIEYKACNDIVFKVAGVKPKYCRPPGGDYDKDVIRGAEAVGLTTVLWTDDPLDYASPGATVIEQRTLGRLSNGGIILLHDGAKQTLQVLPQIIEFAKKKGYKFVGVDELEASMKK